MPLFAPLDSIGHNQVAIPGLLLHNQRNQADDRPSFLFWRAIFLDFMEQRRRIIAKSLLGHSLFGFQIHDPVVYERLCKLKTLLMATCNERNQIALLSENICKIEEKLKTHEEEFLVEPLRHFKQEMELLLDVNSEDDEVMIQEEEEKEEGDVLIDYDETLSVSQEPFFSNSLHVWKPLDNDIIIKQKKTQERSPCGVCCASDSIDNDPLIVCDICRMAVHQTCYGLTAIPEGKWYCHLCKTYLDALDVEKNIIVTHEFECEACCIKAGAMAPTVDGGWVHLACTMFLPELDLHDKQVSTLQGVSDHLQVVCGLDKLHKRRRLRCYFCKKNNERGACAQCALDKCVVAYHALCALRNGIKLRYMEDQGQFGSGCLKHQAEFLKLDRDLEVEVNDGGEKGVKLLGKAVGDTNGGNNELDSDSVNDDSHDSCSDGKHYLYGAKQRYSIQKTPTKMPPPRLLGGPPLRKSGGNGSSRLKRKRHDKLSVESATPVLVVPTPPAATDAASTLASHLTKASYTHKEVNSNSRMILQTNVFAPSIYPPAYIREEPSERDFEYVMVLIASRPLGLGIASSVKDAGIFLHAQKTRNPAILAALKHGVIQDGDEVFAFNDLTLRNIGLEKFENDVVSALSLPVHCWFRTRRKNSVVKFAISEAAPVCVTAAAQNTLGTSVSVKQGAVATHTKVVTSHSEFRPETHSSDLACSKDVLRDAETEVTCGGIDWPWVFLRSDAKLAMKLFWTTLDSAFFLRRMSKRTFSQLQRNVEDICGVRFGGLLMECGQLRQLLVMPRCERVPEYLVSFRSLRKPQHNLLLPGIFTDALGDANTDASEETALEVGTTVSVATRTWPGMNKHGGVVAAKKRVERKYISVVDLDTVRSEKSEEHSFTSNGKRQKCEPETVAKDAAEVDVSTLGVKLFVAVSRTADTEKLSALPDVGIGRPPKHCRFQLQFSTADATVYCERNSGHLNHVPLAKEILMDRHFEVKLSEVDALTNACFIFEVLSIEDRVGDEVSEDDSESEDEEDKIKSKLATLQQQFRSIMELNDLAFDSLTTKVDEEYASKEYYQHELQDIQWRNYERMYQELQAARRRFDESDGGSDMDEDGQVSGSETKTQSDEGENSENEDISFGGMFVNKLKQESSEMCALCELSGGDFTATDTGQVVHPQCALFTPETFFKDGVVHGIDLVDPQRQQLKCSLCGGQKGLSKIQCAHGKCIRAYHVACAFVNGLLTIKSSKYQAWCPRHLKMSGMEQFVELPDHLDEEKSTEIALGSTCGVLSAPPASFSARRSWKTNDLRLKKKCGRQDTSPAMVMAIARTELSSSKTNRKRKRKDNTANATTKTQY
ncbi:unnamed protein product [Peronospora belbahrii]|uniref:PHD-type domain-containing protein n=1 Tax=Peronospora belbahrii TaxID=622444 RepID=A0AAU9L8S2_9STRA|nr:unnamed protein product [Peronospora belbahrii]